MLSPANNNHWNIRRKVASLTPGTRSTERDLNRPDYTGRSRSSTFTTSHAMQQSSTDDSFAHLSRLSQKPGVQGTLILSRETGAIVRSSGLVSRDESADPEVTLPASNTQTDERAENGMLSAEHVAEVVWKFAKAAGDMLQELSASPDDDVKLLRIRSKNKEYVIVPGKSWLCDLPGNTAWTTSIYFCSSSQHNEYEADRLSDARFIAVVIHDTPPA